MTERLDPMVGQELRRGDEASRAAEVLLREGLLSDAMSRAYYAVLHYSRALLLCRGEEPRTHESVLRRFSLLFVKSGLVTPEEGRILGRLQKVREEADYNVETEYSGPQVGEELEAVARFRGAIVRALGELGWRPPGQ
jgi:uncharacterized protein (UPF0332 family)